MAVEIGTGGSAASDFKDLLAKVRTFAVAQGWTSEEYNTDLDTEVPDELFLSGPGSTGTEDVHVNIQTYGVDANNQYGWKIRCATSYDSGLDFSNQPQTSTSVYLPLLNSSIDYWLIVSDRRIMMTMKIGSLYVNMYAGFFLPFATPAEYPYPLYVAATGDDIFSTSAISNDPNLRGYHDPGYKAAYLREVGGSWKPVYNHNGSSGDDTFTIGKTDGYTTWPYNPNAGATGTIANTLKLQIRPLPGESMSNFIVPIHLAGDNYGDAMLGILDSAFWVPGFGIQTEQAFTIGAANAVLSLDASNAGNTETVTIGSKTYTFQATLTDVDGNVQIGANSTETIDNLVAAVNLASGAGTKYAASMTANSDASARVGRGSGDFSVTVDDQAIFTALSYGSAGNSLASTETMANASFRNTVFEGGFDDNGAGDYRIFQNGARTDINHFYAVLEA